MFWKTAAPRGRAGETRARRPGRPRSPIFEALEGRPLLSVSSAVDANGRLVVIADAGDPISIRSASGDVQVEGADPDTGPFPSGGVTAIEVVCTANTGPDSNVIDLAGVAPSRFAALVGVSVDGGGGGDRLIGPDVPAEWGLTAPDAGLLAGGALGTIASFTFASIENLVAGPGDDRFVFGEGASLSGSIDGGGGDDTLDFGGIGDAVSVTLAGSDAGGFGGRATGIGIGFRGIDALIGGLGDDTLTGGGADGTWDLGGSPSYTDGNASLSFSHFEDLHGGGGTDTFVLIGDALGNLAEDLHGGRGTARFLFEGDVVLTGTIAGSGGDDTLDFRDYAIGVSVVLAGSDADGYAGTATTAFSGGGFRGIDSLIGHPATDAADALVGEDARSIWSLGTTSAYEDDSGRPLIFSGFDDVDGGTGDDTYRLDPPAGAALTIDDGGGDDTLDFSPATFGIAIDVDSSGAQGIGPGRSLTLSGPIEHLIGSPFPDAIAIAGRATPRSVEGGPPGSTPGDVLTFDAGGRPVTLSPTRIVALGLAPVTYSGIESTRITNDSGLTIVPSPTTMALAVDPVAPRYGQPLALTLDVEAATAGPGMPTGTVQFAIDGVPLGPAISLVRGVATGPAIVTLHAGPHVVSATYSGDANFAANATSPTVVNVARAPLTIAARDVVRAYGQANPPFAASYGGFVLGQDAGVLGGVLSFATMATATSPPGRYPITPGGLTSTDYAISDVDGTLTVEGATTGIGSTVTLASSIPHPTYGQSWTITAIVDAADSGRPTPTGTVQFVLDGSALGPAVMLINGSASVPAVAPLAVGPHIISAIYSGNATFRPGTAADLETDVARAPLTIRANDATKVSGRANPAFSASYRGFVLGQGPGVLDGSLALETTASTGSPAGSYAIVPGGLTSANYAIDFIDGTLTVMPSTELAGSTITVTPSSAILTYGQSLTLVARVESTGPGRETPAGTVLFAVDGVAFGPPIALVHGAATGPPIDTLRAGSHGISATYSGDASHEAMATPVTNLDVAQAPLTITADDAAKVYGRANPPFDASFGGFVLGQDARSLGGVLTFTTSATPASHVGRYAIVASGATSGDYSIRFVPGTLAVTPAPLAVSAVNVIKVYGLPVPMLTAGYGGFVNGDGPWSLTTPVTLATTATASSTTGFYPITAGGASSPDYAITIVDGLLAVPPSTTTSGPGRVAFVTTLYRVVLGRAPEFTGLDSWLERLASGTTLAEAAREFFGSAERRTLQKGHKAPRIGQKAALAAALHAERLADVPPIALTNPGHVALVTTLYREILNRAPQPSGRRYWLEELAIGTSPAEVARAIFDSPEHKALRHRHGAPRISERTALVDALDAEKRAVRIGTAYPRGPAELPR